MKNRTVRKIFGNWYYFLLNFILKENINKKQLYSRTILNLRRLIVEYKKVFQTSYLKSIFLLEIILYQKIEKNYSL